MPLASPLNVVVKQGPTKAGLLRAEVTWDRNDILADQYDVLRDGTLIGTVGPFVPYAPSMTADGGVLDKTKPYRGPWASGSTYVTGEHVTYGGSHWRAPGSIGTGVTPGTGSWIKVYDDVDDKCRLIDSTVTANQTAAYSVRAVQAGVAAAPSAPASITIRSDSYYGAVVNVGAPTGSDDKPQLQAAVNTVIAAGGGIVNCQTNAVYELSSRVLITAADKIVFRLNGATLKPSSSYPGAADPAGTAVNLLYFTCPLTTTTGTLTSDVAVGDTTATLTTASDLRVGTWLLMSEAGSITGGSPASAAAHGYNHFPGAANADSAGGSDMDHWECLEIIGITGNTVTFHKPCESVIKAATATLQRVAETTPGVPKRDIVIESGNIEGRSSSDASYYQLVYLEQVAGVRVADVTSRYSNQHAFVHRSTAAVDYVGFQEPDHGITVDWQTPTSTPAGFGTSQQQYTISVNRAADTTVISSTFGTSGSMKVASSVTTQRAPRSLMRHCVAYEGKNYTLFNEHGAGSRGWIVENCRAYPGSECQRGPVFLGNSTFAASGRGIIRNIRVEGGPHAVEMQENSYGARVLDVLAYGLADNARSNDGSLVRAYGVDSPGDTSSQWGSLKLTVRRCALFGGQGDGIIVGPQDSPFFGDQPAGPATTVQGSQTMPASSSTPATITVVSTTGFATAGHIAVNAYGTASTQYVAYTGKTGTTFTGCTGFTGGSTLANAAPVTVANMDPAGDGAGYLGARDIIIQDTFLDVTGVAVRIYGTSSSSGRFQVSNVHGQSTMSRPALAAGDYWADNADSGAGGTTSRTDTWSGAAASAWDAQWTSVSEAKVNALIVSSTNNRGRITVSATATADTYGYALLPETISDFDQTYDVVHSTTGTKRHLLVARHGGTAVFDDTLSVMYTNTGTSRIAVRKRLATVVTTITTSTALDSLATNNALASIRFKGVGTSLWVKAWTGGQAAEPGGVGSDASWSLGPITDTSGILQGRRGVGAIGPSGGASMDLDNYTDTCTIPGTANYGTPTAVTWDTESFAGDVPPPPDPPPDPPVDPTVSRYRRPGEKTSVAHVSRHTKVA